jgi:hypothetical protein
MKFISHRGNINGPTPEMENKPEYILQAILSGYDCEIDVRFVNRQLFLGHDTPDYSIDIRFLLDNCDKLWIHCKNIEAFEYLLEYNDLNIFWHQNDDYTLTSKKYIWSYPKTIQTTKCICLMPELNDFIVPHFVFGVCSDYVRKLDM